MHSFLVDLSVSLLENFYYIFKLVNNFIIYFHFNLLVQQLYSTLIPNSNSIILVYLINPILSIHSLHIDLILFFLFPQTILYNFIDPIKISILYF